MKLEKDDFIKVVHNYFCWPTLVKNKVNAIGGQYKDLKEIKVSEFNKFNEK